MWSSTVYRSEVTDTLRPYPKLVCGRLGAHLFNMWQRAFVLSVRRWRGEGRTQLPSYLAVWCWNVFTFEEKRKLTGEGGTGGLRARERLTITPWESQGNCLAMLAETESVSTWGFDTPCLCCDFGTGASCGCDVVQPGFWLLLSAGSNFGFIAMCCVKQQKEGGEVPPRVRGISLLVSVKACLHYQLLYCSVPGRIGFETRGLLSVFQNSHLNPTLQPLFLSVFNSQRTYF